MLLVLVLVVVLVPALPAVKGNIARRCGDDPLTPDRSPPLPLPLLLPLLPPPPLLLLPPLLPPLLVDTPCIAFAPMDDMLAAMEGTCCWMELMVGSNEEGRYLPLI